MTENQLATIVVDLCLKIHITLGNGLFESVYEEVLCYELDKNQISFTRQEEIPVFYDEMKMNVGFKADIIVEDKLILELKSVEKITDMHKKQLLTYLRLTDKRLGLLINFNEALIKGGITKIVNRL